MGGKLVQIPHPPEEGWIEGSESIAWSEGGDGSGSKAGAICHGKGRNKAGRGRQHCAAERRGCQRGCGKEARCQACAGAGSAGHAAAQPLAQPCTDRLPAGAFPWSMYRTAGRLKLPTCILRAVCKRGWLPLCHLAAHNTLHSLQTFGPAFTSAAPGLPIESLSA